MIEAEWFTYILTTLSSSKSHALITGELEEVLAAPPANANCPISSMVIYLSFDTEDLNWWMHLKLVLKVSPRVEA